MKKTSIKEFKVEDKYLKPLTKNEKKVLPLLVEAAKKIDKIFLLQENNGYKGANFYPENASKEEIEEAAKVDPKILSPFTIVEKDETGNLIAVDYHEKYAKLLEPIAKILKEASKIAENKSFKNYLQVLSTSLVTGAYQQIDIAWLAIKGSNLDMTMGPYERNLDKLFFIKRTYQAHVGVINEAKTKRAKLVRDTLYTNIGPKMHRVTPPSIVDMQAEQVIIFAGFLGRALFSEQHLPADSETTERYGSRILGYLTSMDYKFEKLLLPIFEAIFEKEFKERYSKEVLRIGSYYYTLLTSVARQLHRYEGSRERLKELFLVFDEANCVVSGIQHGKHLVLKGVVDQKELEGVMVIQICRIFSEWVIAKTTNTREDYLRGDALTFNFLMREGALQEKDGISWPNFAKMFFEIENLSTIFVRFLEEGTYWEAQEFLNKYLSYDAFKSFNPRLSKIKPI
ncbi:MAG: hypothetical protein NUV69_03970 [Candidatus Curtissbacteria bacterium]|nr:hypothetical protein [Candidatus Curtissbacteria bacterium]